MSLYLTAIILGLGFAALALGIFISMRIFNIPDITTDGSFTLGGAVTAVMLSSLYSPGAAMAVSLAAGFAAGITTGFIHARLKVNALLAGILVMTALYSINLAVMGRANIPLVNVSTLYSTVTLNNNEILNELLLTLLVAGILLLGIRWLLQTDFGLAMRATGNNETMMQSLGTDTGRMKIIGLGLANSLVAFSGCIITQLQGFADINMGIGIVIVGLGAVILGEIIASLFNTTDIAGKLAGVMAGSIVLRLILAWALSMGVDPVYLKLVVALLVLASITMPLLKKKNHEG
jgi:putative ABC transport system permease protein